MQTSPRRLIADPLVSDPQSRRAILVAAEFTRRNNQRELVHALAILHARALFVSMTLVGTGSQRVMASTRTLARLLGLENHIAFVEAEDPTPLQLRQHRVCVISREEGIGSLLALATSAGCARVLRSSAKIAGLTTHALLVAPDDAPALANTLEDLLTHSPQALSA